MPFRKVDKGKVRKYITIGSDRFRIPVSFIDKFTEKGYIEVFFDEENSLIGLKPSNMGYKLSGRSVYCNKFAKYRGRYEAKWSNEHDMVIIDLSSPLPDS